MFNKFLWNEETRTNDQEELAIGKEKEAHFCSWGLGYFSGVWMPACCVVFAPPLTSWASILPICTTRQHNPQSLCLLTAGLEGKDRNSSLLATSLAISLIFGGPLEPAEWKEGQRRLAGGKINWTSHPRAVRPKKAPLSPFLLCFIDLIIVLSPGQGPFSFPAQLGCL